MPNEALIDEQINQYVEQGGIKVSEQAQKIIHDFFDAIILDPHPRWSKRGYKPIDVFNIFVGQIPELLHRVAVDENVEHVITTWDILHWISPRLNFLWKKDDEPPRMSNIGQSINTLSSPEHNIGGANQENDGESLLGLASDEQ